MRVSIQSKYFGLKQIFGELELDVKAGDFVAISGPSGCGKTTLLRILAGLDQDADMSISEPPRRIGFVFQEPRLLPWRTVAENLVLANSRAADTAAAAEQALRAVELWQERNLYPDALSLGMKRRLELARALSIRPDLLILDEPFVSLDRAAAEYLRDLLMKNWRKLNPTVILVSHDIEEGLMLADRFLYLRGQPATITKDLSLLLPRAERNADWLRQNVTEFEA